MFTCEDLKLINKIPDEAEISLKLYAEFFEKYIGNRLYNIYLDNNINFIMQIAPTNYAHLIALNKFKVDANFKGNPLLKDASQLEKFQGFFNLKKGNITLDDLKDIKDVHGNSVFDIYKTRILASPLIYKLLRNSKFLLFDANKVSNNTTIKADYIFVNDIDNNKLHLFIKANNDISYPVSFVNRDDSNGVEQLNYFINGQKLLNINKIDVLDFKSKKLLEVIPGTTEKETAYKEVAAASSENPEHTFKDKYAELKNSPGKLLFRQINKDQYKLLKGMNFNYAAVEKNGKFDIAFKETDKNKVDSILKNSRCKEPAAER